jgi:hypothetical protein
MCGTADSPRRQKEEGKEEKARQFLEYNLVVTDTIASSEGGEEGREERGKGSKGHQFSKCDLLSLLTTAYSEGGQEGGQGSEGGPFLQNVNHYRY